MEPITATSEPLWTLPNLLTFSRLPLTVLICLAIASGWDLVALIGFVVAALTDALDGHTARLLGQTSALGRQLDPLVDKVFVCSTLIFLVPRPGSGVAAWMVAAIVSRELIVQALRSLVEGGGRSFGALPAGKAKTLMQCLAIIAVLLCELVSPGRAATSLRDVLLWSATALTLYSGGSYVSAAMRLLRGSWTRG